MSGLIHSSVICRDNSGIFSFTLCGPSFFPSIQNPFQQQVNTISQGPCWGVKSDHGKGLPYQSVQFSSVTQSCPTLCDPMTHSTPGLPVHHQLPEFTQTYCLADRNLVDLGQGLNSFPPSFLPSNATLMNLMYIVDKTPVISCCGSLHKPLLLQTSVEFPGY